MTSLALIEAGILLLWAAWLSLVTLFNVTDALKEMGILGETWSLASGNFAYMIDVTSIHKTPRVVCYVMFAGVILWEALASLLLWRAFFVGSLPAINQAFLVSLSLWGAFILADEFFIAYTTEGEGGYSVAATHREIFVAFLVSLIALHLL
jgi:hypothetical protein